MRRRAATQIDAPGQDSFLDVVANLVGILIILVMVVAAQAKRGILASESAGQVSDEAALALAHEADTAARAAAAVESNIQEMEARLHQQNVQAALRQQERDRLQLLVTVAERRLAEHRGTLSTDEQVRYDLQQQLAKARRDLEQLDELQRSLQQPRPEVLEHLPTPMARTVFGTEIHFRLQAGRLAYVPWDEMIERMNADASNHLHKLRTERRIELSLPVVAGFGARYILKRGEVELQTRLGPATQDQITLERIYFVDAEPNLGQPVSQALTPGSEFLSRVTAAKPQSTTVTIWVYPDGFDDFRQLKAALFKMGYLTAARPMPDGIPIGGAPNGVRSAAE